MCVCVCVACFSLFVRSLFALCSPFFACVSLFHRFFPRSVQRILLTGKVFVSAEVVPGKKGNTMRRKKTKIKPETCENKANKSEK